MARPRHVALIIEMSNAYGRGLLRGIRKYLDEQGVWSVRYGEYRRGEPPPDWLGRWRGDGIIARIENSRIASAVGRAGAPVVDVSAARLLPSLPCVEVDNKAVASLAAEHLVERGFKRFAFCGVAGFTWSDGRREHFTQKIAEAGFPCDVYAMGRPSRRGTDQWLEDTEAVVRWVERLPKPIGILAAWDGRGLQVLEACRQLGVAVPDEVAVLGVDDDEVLCTMGDPPLSSVVTDPAAAGYRAAQILDRLMLGRKGPRGVEWIRPLGVTLRRSTDVMVTGDLVVSKAVLFIRHEAYRRIGVREVLREVGASRSHLDRRFRAATGRTIHDEIARVRLQRVKQLLETTDLSLSQIADRAGFRHAEYMSYAFTRAEGLSPRAYRQRCAARARVRRPHE
jgi:LacI family transcriptional regulator